MRIALTILDDQVLPVLESLGLRQYGDYVSCRRGEVVGQSSTTETRRLRADREAGAEVFYLKCYRYQGRQWRHRFRRDKASIEAWNCQILREVCDVPAPEVVVHGSRRRGLRLVDAFIMTRGIPNALSLHRFVESRWSRPRDAQADELRQYLLAETARVVSEMHAAGFYHVDLQWRNLLVAEDGSAWPMVYVIDSARGGLRRWRVYAAHGQLRDLSSLAKQAMIRMTARERVRWLQCYFGVGRLRREHRAIVRTILEDRGTKDTSSTA